MGQRLRILRARLKTALDFSAPRQSYGMLLEGDVRRDLYIITGAVCLGIMFTVITGFPGASPIFAAFLKDELGVSDSLFGVLLALPYITVLGQIPYARYLRRHPRLKPLFIGLSLFVRLSFVVLGLASAVMRDDRRVVLVAFVFMLMGLSSMVLWMADLTFQTWMGVAVPPQISGRFFGNRQRLLTAAMLVYALLVSVLTDVLGDNPYKFAILFCIAGLFGVMDILCFFFVRTPELPAEEEAPVPGPGAAPLRKRADLRRFVSDLAIPFRDANYRPVLIFSAVYYFGMQINSPYINVYMLRDLALPVGIQTMLSTLVPGIATILFVTRTGRLTDRFGFRNALLFFGFFSAISPLAWFFVVPSSWWLIVLINFAWGITGVATDLAVWSMTIFRAPAEQRPYYITAKAIAMNLFGIAPAILIGGLLSDALAEPLARLSIPWLGGTRLLPLHVLLLLAAIIRTSAVLGIIPRLSQRDEPSYREFRSAVWQGVRGSIRRRR